MRGSQLQRGADHRGAARTRAGNGAKEVCRRHRISNANLLQVESEVRLAQHVDESRRQKKLEAESMPGSAARVRKNCRTVLTIGGKLRRPARFFLRTSTHLFG